VVISTFKDVLYRETGGAFNAESEHIGGPFGAQLQGLRLYCPTDEAKEAGQAFSRGANPNSVAQTWRTAAGHDAWIW